jgi:hypothetical protein
MSLLVWKAWNFGPDGKKPALSLREKAFCRETPRLRNSRSLSRCKDFAEVPPHTSPHPEETAAGGRLEGWATASWFETAQERLLTMRK